MFFILIENDFNFFLYVVVCNYFSLSVLGELVLLIIDLIFYGM